MNNKKELDIKQKKDNVNNRHIKYYDKTLDILEFILEEYFNECSKWRILLKLLI